MYSSIKGKIAFHLLIILVAQSTLANGGKIVTIKKCCAENEVIDVDVMKCRASGDKRWSPTYFTDTNNEHEETPQEIEGYEIQSKIPSCPGSGVHIIPLRDLDQHSIYAAKY